MCIVSMQGRGSEFLLFIPFGLGTKLKGKGVYSFFSSWSTLVSEENKREGEEDIVTVLPGGCLLHAVINSRLCFSSVSPECCACYGGQGLINRPPSLM